MTAKTEKNCVWTYYDDDLQGEYWDTDCCNGFVLDNDETLKNKRIKFCCYCGKPIEEKRDVSR